GEDALCRAVAAGANRASDQAIARWGKRLGRLSRNLLRRRDALALRNLSAAFPKMSAEQRRGILDACWEHFGRETLRTIRMQNLPVAEIAIRCPFVNAELLEQAISRGKGVILISAHYGGWEVGGLALMSLVKNVRTITRPLDNQFLERDLARIRSRTGAEVLDRKRAAREMMQALSDNAVVVLLPDQ